VLVLGVGYLGFKTGRAQETAKTGSV